MSDSEWWRGTDSILNERAGEFVLAMNGLAKAQRRLTQNSHDAYLFIECAWWISASAAACGRRNDGSVAEAFYWVRNKGFHEIAKALGQIQPGSRSQPLGAAPLGIAPLGGAGSPARWKHLAGPEDGSRKVYNEHLASRPVVQTIGEAVATLVETLRDVQESSGLPVLDELGFD